MSSLALSALSRADFSAAEILETAGEAEHMAELLASTGDYWILRRLRPLAFSAPTVEPTKRAIFVDVETTGLDASKDAVIELGIVPFDYTLDGTIVAVGEPFGSLQDPGFPIPVEITALTGSPTR
jgi:DNA polymerase-3 subunit epsilon